ncbi:ornithine cyclodeaminase [Plantactinospora endophytica]|uniref:Ornithine cyclodeaminase n=1 Tax=Plantactinospora endophytica TaxID=673535 RepID=A0ABQ4DV08_9ACTN|nr:ornithine cyclodeaminase [Plantactinospora endophytica]GIG86268.1 ornithine cyclodeaminase [Plantactinospora endophytica]
MAVPVPSSITYLGGADVAELCADLPVVDLVRDTLLAFGRKDAGIAPETALRWTTPTGASARSLVLPAWAGEAYGCKLINASLGNHRYGLPRAGGLIILADPETAYPICIMEGARISALRTAGVTLAAVRAVRPLADLTSVAFLGCGRQAGVHQELLTAHCPALARITLFDQDRSRAEQTAAAWTAAHPEVTVTVAPQARDAVEQAQLTIAVTTTTEPYVELDWLPEGGTFVNVSLDDAAESLLLGCDHLFVDDWHLVVDDTHRMLGVLARAGRVGAPGTAAPVGGRAVDAELPSLVAGCYARPITASERVVVNPFGMGVHDIVLASAVYAKAAGRGLALPR